MDADFWYDGRPIKFLNLQEWDYVDNALLRGMWYELPNLEYIRRLGVLGNCADVGAYIGTHSLYLSLFCLSSTVYSFEPTPSVYRRLVANLEANGVKNAVTYNLALGDCEGWGKEEACDPARIGSRSGARFVSCDDDADAVKQVTLDSLHLDIDLLKIDVEGQELAVLEGAQVTLENVKHLFVEIWPERVGKTETPLHQAGFKLKTKLEEDLYHFEKR